MKDKLLYLTIGVLVGTFILFFAALPAQADDKFQRTTLAGLAGVLIIVEQLYEAATRAGMTDSQFQTDVELRLRQSGIRVLTEEECLVMPGAPCLYVNIRIGKLPEHELYAYCIDLELTQNVRLARADDINISAPTWTATAVVGVVGSSKLRTLREDVQDMTDEFINAYLAANPKER